MKKTTIIMLVLSLSFVLGSPRLAEAQGKTEKSPKKAAYEPKTISVRQAPDQPASKEGADKESDKALAKRKARKLNEKVHETGQKVIFSDGREATVNVREDLLRKDLEKMPVFLENGSTVYMTPKQAQRYLIRKEKRDYKKQLKQSKKEQKLEKAVKQQIQKQKQKKAS